MAPLLILIALGLAGYGYYWYNKRYVSPDTSDYDSEGYQLQFSGMRKGAWLIGIVAVVTPFIIMVMIFSYMDTYAAYRDGKYKVVHGRVQQLRDTMVGRNRSKLKLFTVDTARFEYNYGAPEISTFHNGLYVRVSYIPVGSDGKDVIKLESE